MKWILYVVGALVGAYVLLRIYWSILDSKPDPLLPERKYDWENELTVEEETALFDALRALRDAGKIRFLLRHTSSNLHLYEPKGLVISLFLLAREFKRRGAVDAQAWVSSFLDRCGSQPTDGVLRLSEDWWKSGTEGFTKESFAEAAYKVLTSGMSKTNADGAGVDENFGTLELRVRAHEELPAEAEGSGRYFTPRGEANDWHVLLEAVLGEFVKRRAAAPSHTPESILISVLTDMANGKVPGSMWTRLHVSERERAVAIASIQGAEAPEGLPEDDARAG